MLSKRRPRAHIWIACGTQRGGANSDALAKFQFRNVGLLVLLIGNVHHFPFFLLLSVQTAQVCSFAPIPSLQDTGVPWARFMPYLDTQELRSKSLALGGWTLVMLGNGTCPLSVYARERALAGGFQPEGVSWNQFPLFSYSMMRKSFGFSAVGEGRSSAALIWVTKAGLIWVTKAGLSKTLVN